MQTRVGGLTTKTAIITGYPLMLDNLRYLSGNQLRCAILGALKQVKLPCQQTWPLSMRLSFTGAIFRHQDTGKGQRLVVRPHAKRDSGHIR